MVNTINSNDYMLRSNIAKFGSFVCFHYCIALITVLKAVIIIIIYIYIYNILYIHCHSDQSHKLNSNFVG